MDEIALLSKRINKVLEMLDPEAYQSHQVLAERIADRHPHARAPASIDPLLFQGRSVIFNRRTPLHVDRRDPKLGWNPLTTAGTYEGGRLIIGRLGLRMWFGGGACVFLRGAILPHEIESFDGAQRISVAHFCHSSLWREMGVTLHSYGLVEGA